MLYMSIRIGDEDEPDNYTVTGLDRRAKAAVAADAYEWADVLLAARGTR